MYGVVLLTVDPEDRPDTPGMDRTLNGLNFETAGVSLRLCKSTSYWIVLCIMYNYYVLYTP